MHQFAVFLVSAYLATLELGGQKESKEVDYLPFAVLVCILLFHCFEPKLIRIISASLKALAKEVSIMVSVPELLYSIFFQ